MKNVTRKLTITSCCQYLASMAILIVSLNAIAASVDDVFPSSMTVITSNVRPLLHENRVKNAFLVRGKSGYFQVLNLDAVRALEDELSQGLPANEHLATQVVKHRLSTMGKPALSQRISVAYSGLTTAMRFGITHYPAVIFDNTTVVIGVSDLEVALNLYRAHKNGGGR